MIYYLTNFAKEISVELEKLSIKNGVYNGGLFTVVNHPNFNSQYLEFRSCLIVPSMDEELTIHVSIDNDNIVALFEIFDPVYQHELNLISAAQYPVATVPFSTFAIDSSRVKNKEFMLTNGWILPKE